MSGDGGDIVARRLVIRGRVQGVGYRAWAEAEAQRLGLRGWVRNRRDGTVEVLAIGVKSSVDALIRSCHRGPSHAQVQAVEVEETKDDGTASFCWVETS